MTCVEVAKVTPTQTLHETRGGAFLGWREQQMDVVVHQHVGVQAASSGQLCFAQQGHIICSITVIQQAGQAVVASL